VDVAQDRWAKSGSLILDRGMQGVLKSAPGDHTHL